MSLIKKFLLKLTDVIGLVLSAIAAPISALLARIGPVRLPLSYRIWDTFNVMPCRYHYYQPVFKVSELGDSVFDAPRHLEGLDLKIDDQLRLLGEFNFADELGQIPVGRATQKLGFYHRNPSIGPCDAELLYCMLRHFKPARIIEVGSGYSSRLIKEALDINKSEGVDSEQVCIEPFEMPWLEELGVEKVIRSKVENVDTEVFESLERDDILFIDSSHVVRTGGDVTKLYLEILPKLKSGVIIHAHDIFTPYEYPRQWVVEMRRFWTEQYLLEAFLSFNKSFEVVLSANYLAINHGKELSNTCPRYAELGYGHGSFWIRRM